MLCHAYPIVPTIAGKKVNSTEAAVGVQGQQMTCGILGTS